MNDSNDLTPWEDINPPMVSAQRQGPVSQSSAQADARTVFRNELVACLALTAPAGMTEEARRDWLAVAWDSLKHLPPSILEIGTRKARTLCDHPSKIVPTIVAETADHMRLYREGRAEKSNRLMLPGPRPKRDVMSHRGEPMSDEETAELNGILERLGATARYRSDGSRYTTA